MITFWERFDYGSGFSQISPPLPSPLIRLYLHLAVTWVSVFSFIPLTPRPGLLVAHVAKHEDNETNAWFLDCDGGTFGSGVVCACVEMVVVVQTGREEYCVRGGVKEVSGEKF